MSRIHVTLASSPYDVFRDLLTGDVQIEGVDLNHLNLPVEECFYRFLHFREFDISELSFAKFCALRSQGNQDYVGLPVFPSRVFRLSSIFVRPDGPVKTAEDLRGKRIGIPEWAQTASVYTRGWLTHEVGIGLQEVDWYQAGVDNPGRREKVRLNLPEGVRLTPVPERSLSDLLVAGELDAIFSAHPPQRFERNDGSIIQLFPDHIEREAEYYRTSSIFPIMHVIALRRDIVDRHPWLPMSFFKAFEKAKNNSLERALTLTASSFPIPWLSSHAADAQKLFGEDWWPYGLEANRHTLEAFLGFLDEQGVTERRLEPEALFPAEVVSSFKI